MDRREPQGRKVERETPNYSLQEEVFAQHGADDGGREGEVLAPGHGLKVGQASHQHGHAHSCRKKQKIIIN